MKKTFGTKQTLSFEKTTPSLWAVKEHLRHKTKGLRCLAHRVKHNANLIKLLRNLMKKLQLGHPNYNCEGCCGLV